MKTTTETVEMLVRVKVNYDTKKARRDAMAAIRKHLYISYASAGDGCFHVESGRVKLAPKPNPTFKCNGCDWRGPVSDCCWLGGVNPVGPLCPVCRETGMCKGE